MPLAVTATVDKTAVQATARGTSRRHQQPAIREEHAHAPLAASLNVGGEAAAGEDPWEEPQRLGQPELRAEREGWVPPVRRRDLKVLPPHPFSWQQYLSAGNAGYGKKVQWIPGARRSSGGGRSHKGVVTAAARGSNNAGNAMAGKRVQGEDTGSHSKDGNGSEGKGDSGSSTSSDGRLVGTGARSDLKASNVASCSYGGGYCTSFGTPDSNFEISYHGGKGLGW